MKDTASLNKIAAFWGVSGVVLLLGFAVYRLVPFARDLLGERLDGWQIVILIVWCAFMIYTEGYKAFYKQFSPRVVARAQYLLQRTTVKRTILAPLFCMGYFGASKKQITVAYVLVVGIVALIVLVHFVSQPWRGIIDVGVVLGLLCGIVSVMWYGVRAIMHPTRLVTDPAVI